MTVLSESVYAPVRGWPRGRSIRAHIMTVGVGVLIVIGALTAFLRRNRFIRLSGATVFALALFGVFYCWPERLPEEYQAEGTVAFFGAGMSAGQAFRQKLTLEVDAIGQPQQWTAHLQPGEKLAFVTRMVDPFPRTNPMSVYSTTAVDSPVHSLAREAYMADGVRVIGQGYPRNDTKNGFAEVFLVRDR